MGAQAEVLVYLKGQNKDLDQSLAQGKQALGAFKGFAIGAFIAIGAAVATGLVGKVIGFGKELFKLYDEQAKAEAKLAGVIRATGEAAGFSLDQQKQIAAILQEQTGLGDELILKAQAVISTFRNIRGEEFKEGHCPSD